MVECKPSRQTSLSFVNRSLELACLLHLIEFTKAAHLLAVEEDLGDVALLVVAVDALTDFDLSLRVQLIQKDFIVLDFVMLENCFGFMAVATSGC